MWAPSPPLDLKLMPQIMHPQRRGKVVSEGTKVVGRCGGCKSPAAESLQNAGVELNEMLFSGSLFAGM